MPNDILKKGAKFDWKYALGVVSAIVANRVYDEVVKTTPRPDSTLGIHHYHVGLASMLVNNSYLDGVGLTLVAMEALHPQPFGIGDSDALHGAKNALLAGALGSAVIGQRVFPLADGDMLRIFESALHKMGIA